MTATPPEDDPKRSEQSAVDQQVAQNLLRLRTMRGLSTTRLATILKAMGRPIPATGITRIEKGRRRVDAGELSALAVALDVSPLTLLLPWEDDPDTEVKIADVGIETITARALWEWALGIQPWSISGADPEGEVQRFRLDSLPPFVRFGSSDVALRRIAELEKLLDRHMLSKITDSAYPEFIADYLNSSMPTERKLEMAKLGSTAIGQRVQQDEIEKMTEGAEAFRDREKGGKE